MGLKIYRNIKTGEEVRSLKVLPKTEWEVVISAPNQKFMICGNAERGISKIKDQEKILTARARNYSRDVDLDDNIQINLKNGLNEQVHRNLLNKDGKRRKKMDDL